MTSKSMKASGPKPLTKDEQAAQIARFLTQKREQLFQLALTSALRAGAPLMLDTVDKSIALSDYALEKLYPIPQEESK